jgi:hypothetical protein
MVRLLGELDSIEETQNITAGVEAIERRQTPAEMLP